MPTRERPTLNTLTVPEIVAAYTAGTARRRLTLRALYPGLKLEFDAIDMTEAKETPHG